MLQVSDLEINDAHIIRSRWHPKLNQILIGGGDGIVRVFYDPNKSHNGAKLCVGKCVSSKYYYVKLRLDICNIFIFHFFFSSKA